MPPTTTWMPPTATRGAPLGPHLYFSQESRMAPCIGRAGWCGSCRCRFGAQAGEQARARGRALAGPDFQVPCSLPTHPISPPPGSHLQGRGPTPKLDGARKHAASSEVPFPPSFTPSPSSILDITPGPCQPTLIESHLRFQRRVSVLDPSFCIEGPLNGRLSIRFLSFKLKDLGISGETRLAFAAIIQPVTPSHRFKHSYFKRQPKSRVELACTDPAVAFQHPA
jgi:hypothetical protein